MAAATTAASAVARNAAPRRARDEDSIRIHASPATTDNSADRRVRHVRPASVPATIARRRDGCCPSRTIAHTISVNTSAKVSSRQPSTAQLTLSTSMAQHSAAPSPATGPKAAAPARYAAGTTSTDEIADATLTATSLSFSSQSWLLTSVR